jgi:purine-nucleoside phosphorylase
MSNMKERVDSIIQQLTIEGITDPEIGIILGTGLGSLVNEIEIEKSIPYETIQGFPKSTVEFHKGRLIYGTLSGKKIMAMQGRFHYYEGYSAAELVIPVRVMHGLGIEKLLVSNAAGNMNMGWKKGDLMLLNDHINLQPDNPLRGEDGSSFGQIFVDMSQPYDLLINDSLKNIASKEHITLREGVYAAVAGPNLETKAEYRYLRMIGADAVGMSTVPEVIAANQIGLPVAAVSVLTDDCDPDNLAPVNIEEILSVAKEAEKGLVKIIVEFLKH